LLNAQRKWIAARDPFCKAIADGFKGGTIAPVVYSDCRVEQTIRRTIWLEGLAAPAASPVADTRSGALKAFLKTYLREHDASDGETRYAVAWKDLNGDRRPEAIVYLMGDRWCGSGGCDLLVLEQSGSGFAVRGKMTITREPIAILSSAHQGWKDLIVQIGGGGVSSGRAVISFHGGRYASNPTVPLARRLGPQEAAEVLINADDPGEVL
jgi:hypothetical protein